MTDEFFLMSARVPGAVPLTCYFYTPAAVGAPPEPVSLQGEQAKKVVVAVAQKLMRMRIRTQQSYGRLSEVGQQNLVNMRRNFGLRFYGQVVVGDPDPATSIFRAGSVSPILRTLFMSPTDADNPFVLLHEVAHLSALGKEDKVVTLVSPDGDTVHDLLYLPQGWQRYSVPAAGYWGDGWKFIQESMVIGGTFFEEAMAELIHLQLYMDWAFHGVPPVVFSGKRLNFELPALYGHAVAGWGILKLEEVCPGVVKELVSAVSGDASMARLKKSVSAAFPELFDELFRVSGEGSLAHGTELILEALESRRM